MTLEMFQLYNRYADSIISFIFLYGPNIYQIYQYQLISGTEDIKN